MSDGSPYTIDEDRTLIVNAYRNTRLIAEQVCPYVAVGKKLFSYHEYEKHAAFTLPETEIGRRSEANEVEFGTTQEKAECIDRGLSFVAIDDDQEQAPEGHDILNSGAETTMDLVLLRHEVSVAQMFNDAENYENHFTLGTSGEHLQLDHADSDPLPYFLEMLDEPLMRPNTLTINHKLSTKLRTHPAVLKGFHGTTDGKGLVPLEYVKEQLELENIFVGYARHNTAKKGQAATMQRAWDNSLSFTYLDPLADTKNGRMTFAFTARHGNRVAKSKRISAGLGEGTKLLVGETTIPLAIAKDCGLLLSSPLSQ